MGIRLMDSFDWAYSTASLTERGWSNSDATNITLETSGGPTGGKKYVRFGGGLGAVGTSDFDGIARTLNSRIVGTTIRIAFWIRITAAYAYDASLVAGESLVRLDMYETGTSDAPNISVGMVAGGFLAVYRMETTTANGRTVAATGTTDLRSGTWKHVELEIVLNTTTGSVKSWVDGIADINSTGIDTQDVTGFDFTFLSQAKFGSGDNNPSVGFDVDIADILIWDDDTSDATNKFSGTLPLHTHNISAILPTSDDAVQFTRSTGAVNAQNVDDPFSGSVDGDTTYNSSSNSSHVDNFGFSYPFFADAVYSIQTISSAKIDSSSNNRARIRGSAKNVSVLNSSDSFVSNQNYSIVEHVFAKNPNTGTDWTNATLSSTKFGYTR